jgi:hypothetical protein
MLLSPDSVLVAPPLLLNIKQRRFLTGIRFAAESAQLFFDQLAAALEKWHDLPSSGPGTEEHLSLFASAWALTDNARRFHRLLWKIPELSKLPCATGFVNRWAGTLRKVRDAMQHPDGDYRKDMSENYTFGSLYWVDSRFRTTTGFVYAHTVNAGPQANSRLRDAKFPSPIPIDSEEGVHSLVLSTAGAAVKLHDLMDDIKQTLSLVEDYVQCEWQRLRQSTTAKDAQQAARLAVTAQTDTSFRMDVGPVVPAPSAESA